MGTYTEKIGRRTAIQLDSDQLTSSALFFLEKNRKCHKLEATLCNNSLRITRRRFTELLNKQNLPEKWKLDNSMLPMNLSWREQIYAFMQRTVRVNEFPEFKMASNCQRSRQDRASDRNWSIRICRSSGFWSASTVTTTRKFEVLGAYITRNWTIRTTLHSSRDWPQIFWSHVITAVVKLRATTGGHSSVRYNAATQPKIVSIGFN